MRPAAPWVGACACALVLPATARAEGVAACPLRDADRACVAVEARGSASPGGEEVRAVHLAPGLAASVRVARRVSLTLDAALASTSVSTFDEPLRRTLRVANPIVGAHVAALSGERGAVRVGLVAGAPLVTVPGTIPTNVVAAYGDRVALAARGFEGSWLWARNAVPVAIVARGLVRPAPWIDLAASLEPGVLASVSSAPSRVAVEASVSAALRVGPGTIGARGHAFAASRPIVDGDFAAVSIVPFATLDLGPAVLRAEVAVNLDGPEGPAARGGTVWGAAIAGAARF